MRIMPISDSPWAPTGFGTNTKNVCCIFAEAGHKVGYGGCQNPKHDPDWKTAWPLGDKEKTQSFELLPIMHPGQEKFGEKSFDQWCSLFKPDLILTHLDIQMFQYITERKKPMTANIPLWNDKGDMLTRKERTNLMNKLFKEVQAGPPWKIASIIPIDGQPSIPNWAEVLKLVDYPIAMAKYGQKVMREDFPQLGKEWHDNVTFLPHGVDCGLFKPKMVDKPDNAFVVGTVARNQHRKNIPRLMKAFKHFVDKEKLSPDQARLMLHMDWTDYMGWNIQYMAEYYNMEDYLLPQMMGAIDKGQAPTEEEMVDIYNMMDVFALPTAGEGFGIPTLEALACGKPVVITNYTTSYELVKAEDPYECDPPLWPQGKGAENGRDHLVDDDWSDRGCLVPYKDMWWDTPQRAAPQRGIVSEVAMAEAFSEYYNNPKKRLEHGKNARSYALEYYDWNTILKSKWLDFIKKVQK